MRQNVCLMIEEIKGTKSTKIMELINRKLQKDKEKMLPKHIKDKRLSQYYENFRELQKKTQEVKAKLEQRKDELDLEWQGYGDNKHYILKNRCRISKEDYETLQKAQDLISIGERKDAREIWTKMIQKHKLFTLVE